MDIYDASSTGVGPSSSPARLSYVSEKHPRHTLEAVNVLRKHRELCDVVLIVGQRRIFGHRVVLSACSPYFHAMFTGELVESRQMEVTVFELVMLSCWYLLNRDVNSREISFQGLEARILGLVESRFGPLL